LLKPVSEGSIFISMMENLGRHFPALQCMENNIMWNSKQFTSSRFFVREDAQCNACSCRRYPTLRRLTHETEWNRRSTTTIQGRDRKKT
jgi:hypothetical protein